ncbi:MAG: hypothetical protein K2Q06_15495 [Parvularculaceae bacterium]|nr:hypothetical protein [Parvularculaceae bacterium]
MIVAAAILWNGGFGQKPKAVPGTAASQVTEEDFARWYARAVGDIRNDIVVNCGCCGDGAARPKEKRESF